MLFSYCILDLTKHFFLVTSIFFCFLGRRTIKDVNILGSMSVSEDVEAGERGRLSMNDKEYALSLVYFGYINYSEWI